MTKESAKKDQFTWKETWFLDKLKFGRKMILEIHLIGGKKEPAEDLYVGKVNLGPAIPIVRDPSKRASIRLFQKIRLWNR